MENFKSLDALYDFAIGEEEAAAKFYREIAGKLDRAWMRETFEQFAREEDGHKAKLLKMKSGDIPALSQEKILDLKIGDYLVDIETNADMDYQDALIVAMKKEKAAFKMYTTLAGLADNEQAKELLLSLAQEEAKHKLRFEIEYDDVILKEN
ncbi:MAG: ferritin family protein [Deltaproteobacteria bacterium]|nr:ferritin family protein [Deltaproteobacteria bacterium]